MSETLLPKAAPELSELEKLEIKRQVIGFANKHNMRYRDYGGYVALEIPIYNNELLIQGELDAALYTTKHRKHRAKKAPRSNETEA